MKSVSTSDELDHALAGRKVVALFHATWCPYCRAFRPVFQRLAGQDTGYQPLEVVLDDEQNPLWDRYSIEAIPTVLFFEDGKVVRRLDARRGIGLDETMFRSALERAS